MACKRTAASDLNHDNWNDEDEPEEAGTFTKAPQDVLEKRVVRAARRRLPARGGDGPTKSAFGSFAGFKTTPAASAASPFSFLAAASKSENPLLGQSAKSPSSATAATSNGGGTKASENGTDKPSAMFASTEPVAKSQDPRKTEASDKGEQNIFRKSSDYYAKLKGLNESVTQWIKSHVDSNPFCILTPIFRDYERYLKDIEASHGREATKSSSDLTLDPPMATSSGLLLPPSSSMSSEKTANESKGAEKKEEKSIYDGAAAAAAAKSSLSGGSSSDWASNNSIFGASNPNAKSVFGDATAEKTGSSSKSMFGNAENNPFLSKSSSSPASEKKKKDDAESPKPRTQSSGYMSSFSQTNTTNTSATFSFGQSSTTNTSPSAGFSFGSAKPFSFGSHVVAAQDTEAKPESEDKEDEDEPPKPDFKPITEDDAFFEKRCKVFVKKDGNFSERGIGVLFLKSTPNGKTQLIVRADNSLGNLLINTLLTSSIPTKRMNKNMVMLVCLPLPDSEPPPTPVLLRVKTAEDADTLIETLDKNKK